MSNADDLVDALRGYDHMSGPMDNNSPVGWPKQEVMNSSPLPSPIENYIRTALPAMEGWCTPAKAEALAHAVLTDRPQYILEVGVFAGRSLILLALACHFNDRGHVFGVDPWDASASADGLTDVNRDWWLRVDHSDILAKCRKQVTDMNLESRVTLLRATSEMVVPFFNVPAHILGHPWIDLCHIDGNHSEAHALHDVLAYIPLMKSGAILIFDDINWESTQPASRLILESCDHLYNVGSPDGQLCGFFRKR